VTDERLRDAIRKFLAEERAHAAHNIEWIREHSQLKSIRLD
jgi:hypothetical protein